MANERQQIQVIDPVPLMDTGSFEHLQRIASAMARSSLIPDCLRMTRVVDEDGYPVKENGKAVVELLPYESILANCFLVVEQAVRWGASPFAVAQCVSVVRGKLCYEGKLVAAIVEAKLGVRLTYTYDGKSGDQRGIIVAGQVTGETTVRTVSGTVGSWKTTGKMSPWQNAENHERMLAYRGAREWARRHAPGIMLGVYTDDEMDALQQGGRTTSLRGIEPVRDALSGEPGPKPKAIENKPVVAMSATVDPDGVIIENTESSPGVGVSSPPPTAPGEVAAVTETVVEGEPQVLSTSQERDSKEDLGSPTGQDEADEDQAPPEPTDDASYQRYVFWWASNAVKTRDAASARWKSERTIRNKLQISNDTVEACKKFLAKLYPEPPKEA